MPGKPMLSLMDTEGELLHLYKDRAADDTYEATRTHIGDVLHRVLFLNKLSAAQDMMPGMTLLCIRRISSRRSLNAFVYVPYKFQGRICLGCHEFYAADTAKLLAWALDESYTMPATTKVEFRRIAA